MVFAGTVPTEVNPYISGADISATAGQWIGLYELDGAGKVVKFLRYQIQTADLATTGVTATKGAETSGVDAATATAATWVMNQSNFNIPAANSSLFFSFNGVTVTLMDAASSANAILEDDTTMNIQGAGAIEPLKAASQTNPVKEVKVGYDATSGGQNSAAFYAIGMLNLVIDPGVNSPLKDFVITPADASGNITFTAPAGTAYNDRTFTGDLFDLNTVQHTPGTVGNVTGKASVAYTFSAVAATGQITVTLANPAKTVTVNVTSGQSAADVAEAILTALDTVDGYAVTRSGATLRFETIANAASANITVNVQ